MKPLSAASGLPLSLLYLVVVFGGVFWVGAIAALILWIIGGGPA